MLSGDTTLILHSQVIPPSSNNQEDTNEISTTNITSITSPDIVVKELLSDDNKESTESESAPKRVKTGWVIGQDWQNARNVKSTKLFRNLKWLFISSLYF